MTPEQRRLEEKVDTLAGERGGGVLPRAAVRIEDLAALLSVPSRLKSAKSAGDPPTQAEFDALVDDVHALHRVLKAAHDSLQARLLP